ncbi:hypothetical protein [Streptomyces sp. RKAG293]|uniref:hypothetical protein n=1 Tax=Streptomyces sp. RKAG293 TaxID=2893403 RepID=UPI0020338370|nr:hypothetical protein [Streptomyces sp. RKAG293]MCM2416946.1 hypothetical protein [Streptomyces sp. RKAG293]
MTQAPPVVPGPTVERFAGAALRSGEPFTVLYGPGVSDVFVNSAYLVCDLEQTLWQLLRAEGYERIAFCSLQHPVYFLDTRSRDLSVRGGGTGRRPAAGGPGAMRTPGMRGPMGNLVVPGFRAPHQNASPGTAPGSGAAPPPAPGGPARTGRRWHRRRAGATRSG